MSLKDFYAAGIIPFIFLFGLALALPSVSYAACSSPSGRAGSLAYDSAGDLSTMLACDGTDWVPWAGWTVSGYPAPQYSSSASVIDDLSDVDTTGKSSNDVLTWDGASWGAQAGASPLWLQNGSDAYYNTGNVGIGTANPNGRLHVKADDWPLALFERADKDDGNTSSNVLYSLRTHDGGPGADGIGNSMIFLVETETEGTNERVLNIDAVTTDATAGSVDSDIYISPYLNSSKLSDALVIKSTGNVGIGTADPSYTLDVSGDTYITGVVGIGNPPTGAQLYVMEQASNDVANFVDANSSAWVDIMNTSGNNSGWSAIEFSDWVVGNTAQFGLHSNGGTGVIRLNVNGGNDFIFQQNGVANKASGAGDWAGTSDARLKDTKGDYKKGLDEVLKIRPIIYNFKEDNARGHDPDQELVGVMAQEIMKVFPRTVTQAEDGYYDFNSTELTYALINAVQEQQAQIEALRTEIETLKAAQDNNKPEAQ